MTRRLQLFGVLLLTILTYGLMLTNQFVYEEPPGALGMQWRWADFLGTFTHPTRYLSEWLWQGSALVIHAENLGFHLLVIVVVFALAERLGATGWIVAGLVALHPIMSQAVLYGWERMEVLTTLGILIACWGATFPTRWGALTILVGSWFAFATKENGVIVVGLVPIVAALGPWRTGWRRVWPWLVISTGLLTLIALRGLVLLHVRNVADGSQTNPWIWAGQMTAAIGRMFGLYLWPDRLSIEHLIPSASVGLLVGLGFVVAGLVILRWLTRHPDPVYLFALALVVCALAPRYVLHMPASFFPEHQWYGPAIGISFAVGHAFEDTPDFLVIPLIALALVTHDRVHVWHDNLSLWTNAVSVEPCSPRAHYNLSLAFTQRGERDRAADERLRAIAAAELPSCGGQERLKSDPHLIDHVTLLKGTIAP